MSRRKQSKPQHVDFPDNKTSLAVGVASGQIVPSVTTEEKVDSKNGSNRKTPLATSPNEDQTVETKNDTSEKLHPKYSSTEGIELVTNAREPEVDTSSPSEDSEIRQMAVERSDVDMNSALSPESDATGNGQFLSPHRSLFYPRFAAFDSSIHRTWDAERVNSTIASGGQVDNKDQESLTSSTANFDGDKRPRQDEARGEMYTCERCSEKFQIFLDYIRHKDFECTKSLCDMSPDDDHSNECQVQDSGYVISGNVIMASEEDLISKREIVDHVEGDLNIDEGNCGSGDEEAQPSASRGLDQVDKNTDSRSSEKVENGHYHDNRSSTPDSVADSDGASEKNSFTRSLAREHSSNGDTSEQTEDNVRSNKTVHADETEKLRKDIVAAEAMAHAIQNMSAFVTQNGASERPDVNAIMYQVRMIQQQQAYQVQMLNFLQWQLALTSANHQSASRPFNSGVPMNAPMQPPFLPGPPGMQGNPLMPQMMAAMAMNNFHQNGDGGRMAEIAKARLMMGMQQTTPDGGHSMRGFLPKPAEDNHRNEQEQRYQLKVATEQDTSSKIDEKQSKLVNDILPDSDCNGDNQIDLANAQIADDTSSSHGSQEDGELRDGALKSTAEEHRHRCRFCHKIFGSDSALQIHIRSHTGERPFKCNICGNRFTTKGNLKVHFTRHKSKYPHIPMNGQPVPEYLDHVPTSNGVPYGMSILPEKAALERPRLHGNPSIHLSPQQAALLNQRDSHKLQALFPSQMAAFTGKNEADLVSERPGKVDMDEHTGAADVASAIHAQLLQRRRAELLESQWSSESKKGDIADLREQKSNMALLQAAMLPFLPGLANRQQIDNVPPHLRYLLPHQLAFQNQTTSSNAINDIKLPTLPTSHVSNGVKHEQRMDIARSQASSSETTKLQRLVENIDRGRVLQKNECHICHRVLSCQSALKLHYRTHTGERPHKCDLCSRAFTTRGNLRTHYSSVHRQQMPTLPPSGSRSSNAESYNCTLCTARFRDATEFQRHMQMHAMVQAQQQQQRMLALGRETEQRGVSPKSSERFPKTDDTGHADDEIASVKSERSLNQISTESQEMEIGGERDRDERSPSPHSEVEDQLARVKRESVSEEQDVTKADVKGEPSIPAPTNHPLDPLVALANISNGADMNGHADTMLEHQLAAIDRARAGRLTVCEICEKPFSCQSALEIHIRTHTKERPFTCRVCQRSFTTKGNLKQHLLTHNITDVPDQMLAPVASPKHSQSTSSTPSSSPTPSDSQISTSIKRPFEDNDASETPAKRAFPRHWCHICQKQFSSASSLQIHNRTHTGEKPFACNVCGRAFTTKGNLKVHMGTHVWGAGGSRRGRRISMDNPIISPWMKNMTRAQAGQPGLPLQATGQIADPATLYHYAALARGILSAKQDASRFMIPMPNGQAGNTASSPVSSNGSPLPPTELGSPKSSGNGSSNNPNVAAATEWFLKAYQRTQEQVN